MDELRHKTNLEPPRIAGDRNQRAGDAVVRWNDRNIMVVRDGLLFLPRRRRQLLVLYVFLLPSEADAGSPPPASSCRHTVDFLDRNMFLQIDKVEKPRFGVMRRNKPGKQGNAV
ncbi:hypothetical protein HPP92_024888 [Vanilla planifolia]|uniref:Uncharacterized protein n=1 Tax=Vanilla planifolia TaxID=51239 RepID=A0A835PG47_VANPL|nr:hypothetical protein HPP92_025173 [Vanilla planifolia]KAG0453584.1 hypothetical protein HPP92_024888 [Vanilla planifolia]